MADICDNADDFIADYLARALTVRKPVPTRCEDCGEPCAVLANGARARYCDVCLTWYTGEQ